MGRRSRRRELYDAIRAGDRSRVDLVLAEDPELADAPNSHGNTASMEAIAAGRLAMLRLLVERGADPNRRNDGGWSLMDCAASAGSIEIMRYLVEVGCAMTLNHAAGAGDLEAMEQLLAEDEGRIAEKHGRRHSTPLHDAAAVPQLAAMRLLLERGADVRARDRDGQEPLARAVEARAAEAATLLLDHGADPSGSGGHFGGTVLHRAIVLRQPVLARLLLERGADPSAIDYAGKTALHEAVVNGTQAMVKLVLEFGPDRSLRTRRTPTQPGNETAEEYALRTRKPKLAELIRTGGIE